VHPGRYIAMSTVESFEKKERRIRRQWIGILILLIFARYLLLPQFLQWIHAPGMVGKIADEMVVAFVISILLFIVEGRIRKAHLQDVELGVLQATLGMAVPEELANELSKLIKHNFYMRNVRYYLTFLALEGDRELFTLRMEMLFKLHNISDVRQTHTLRLIADDKYGRLIPSASPVDFRKVMQVRVNHEEVHLESTPVGSSMEAGAELGGVQRLLAWLRVALRRGRSAPHLFIDREQGTLGFSKEIVVPGRGAAEIYFRLDEVLRLTDRKTVYVLLQPAVNLRLAIANRHPRIGKVSADMNHRPGVDFTSEHETNYRLERGILPGQSFDVSWELRESGG